ncbi:hypothetical protein AHMF7605_18540 [Adhaeribacter arboris]|uniref:7TM-DISM receptor extracellular domain-containing protein n=1 Tax=Adhaeribacter arboris TaxID=2072846 RepID=A0A2T2YIM7_9BACT|nr:7TM-DISM domain-containing protein [Adhaeribacter arboris]PSR55361.1 hypothetical protein AHMF7605_18540 [Adhaeribacter arboris]
MSRQSWTTNSICLTLFIHPTPMRLLLLVAVFSLSSLALAQAPLSLPGKLPTDQFDIGPYTEFYQDLSEDILPLSDIMTKDFRPFREKRNERATFAEQSIMVTWLRFTLRNTHPQDTLHVLHQTIVHGLITLYENNTCLGQTGISLPPQRRVSRFALPLSLPPLTERTYYVQVVDYIWSPSVIYSKLLSIRGSYELDYLSQWHMNVQLAVVGLLAGGCFL